MIMPVLAMFVLWPVSLLSMTHVIKNVDTANYLN